LTITKHTNRRTKKPRQKRYTNNCKSVFKPKCVSSSPVRTKLVEIKRGVKQGYVFLPLFFNLYSEEMFSKVLENEDGIRINGIPLNNLCYADDTALLAENMLNNVITSSREYGLTLNVKKTKYMIVTKTEVPKKAKSWKESRTMTNWEQVSTVL